MKFFQSVTIFSFALLCCACGRPASDIVHPAARPDLPLSDTDDASGPSISCNSGMIAVRSSNGDFTCLKRPEIRAVSGASLSAFWNSSVTLRCTALKSYILAFATEYFKNSTTEVTRCSKILENSNALFVSFLINSNVGQSTISFEVADSANQVSTILICTKERSTFIAGTHCTERFITGMIPTLAADLAPEPSPNFVDFFPSLAARLKN